MFHKKIGSEEENSQEKRRVTDQSSPVKTVLGSQTTVKGDVKGTESIAVEGTVEGNIDLSATLFIYRSGRLMGNVKAQHVIVEGTLNGDVVAEQQIELRQAAQVNGNLQAGGIAIAEGAYFQGEIKMSSAQATEPTTFKEKRSREESTIEESAT